MEVSVCNALIYKHLKLTSVYRTWRSPVVLIYKGLSRARKSFRHASTSSNTHRCATQFLKALHPTGYVEVTSGYFIWRSLSWLKFQYERSGKGHYVAGRLHFVRLRSQAIGMLPNLFINIAYSLGVLDFHHRWRLTRLRLRHLLRFLRVAMAFQ